MAPPAARAPRSPASARLGPASLGYLRATLLPGAAAAPAARRASRCRPCPGATWRVSRASSPGPCPGATGRCPCLAPPASLPRSSCFAPSPRRLAPRDQALLVPCASLPRLSFVVHRHADLPPRDRTLLAPRCRASRASSIATQTLPRRDRALLVPAASLRRSSYFVPRAADLAPVIGRSSSLAPRRGALRASSLAPPTASPVALGASRSPDPSTFAARALPSPRPRRRIAPALAPPFIMPVLHAMSFSPCLFTQVP